MMRKTALVGLGILLLTLSGCLIDKPPGQDGDYLSVVRIRPDNQLQAAPDGTCYELWFLDINDFDNPTEQTFTPLTRFQWDPENFRTLDETGTTDIPLYTQTGKGIDVGLNFLDHFLVLLTIEPLNDPDPTQPNGPIIGLFLDVSAVMDAPSPLLVNHEGTMQLDFFGAGVMENSGGASATLVAQSLTKRLQSEGEDVCWRGDTESMGIWFAQTQIQDRVIEDTAGVAVDPAAAEGRGTLFTRDVDDDADARLYNIWIFPDHPESSWSNFDDVFPNRSPNIIFRDGTPIIPAGTFPPFSAGVNRLGGNPIPDGGTTIGYMYFPDTLPVTPGAADYPDTCFLRVDHPELTYCTNDSIDYTGQPFADTNLIIRVFRTTWADTLITPSLLGLPVHQLPFGMEYEAWLIFDSVNNPLFLPLSLGRMDPFDVSGITYMIINTLPNGTIDTTYAEGGDQICDGAQTFDRANPYTDLFNFDSNFTFPGEDFLEALPNGLPTPLDLFNIPGVDRVKLWITLEPIHRPEFFVEDWAPEMPFTQLIVYVGEILPDPLLGSDDLICDPLVQPLAPQTYTIPLRYRPISRERIDLAEGHNWPTVKFFISSADEAGN